MSACDVQAIHEALAEALRAIDGWNVSPWPSDRVVVPMMQLWPGSPYMEPWGAYGHGMVTLRIEVRAYASTADAEAGLNKVAELMSVRPGNDAERVATIHHAVEADPTLGGVVAHTVVDQRLEVNYATASDTNVRYAVGVIPVTIRVAVREA